MSEIGKSPFEPSPVAPVQYEGEHQFTFSCHKGIECWNACCKQIDITLTPYDVVRLKNRLGMRSDEFLKKYTVPFQMDRDGVPGVKLRTQDDAPVCLLMTDEGCTVYEDRPASCRYYPVGLLTQRKQDEYTDVHSYVLVEEEHCKGHGCGSKMSIDEYRKDQGVDQYDEYSRGWRQLILKKMSLGPAIGKPSDTSLSLWFMACYNHDQFRDFINSASFQKSFDLDNETMEKLNSDDVELMQFGIRFLKQVMFGEQSIPLQQGAAEQRAKEREDIWKARREAEVAAHMAKQDEAERDVTSAG